MTAATATATVPTRRGATARLRVIAAQGPCSPAPSWCSSCWC
ncbi:hypothetical protein ACU686_32995 [Yinghuangia aomiensis]